MRAALYGPLGFYRRERPAAHFRTSVHTSALFATAVGRLAAEVDEAIGAGQRMQVVDIGAGRGELLTCLADVLPARVQLTGVDVVARPAGLPARVRWQRRVPEVVRGLMLANEWLDNVPLDVVEVDAAGRARIVLVDPRTGDERLGAQVTGATAAWLERHWPLDAAAPGVRAEVGGTRDAAWTRAVRRLQTGVAIAVDYHHRREARPVLGTLTGFRSGRMVAPIPDGSCDLTAHVALDSCAAAVAAAVAVGAPAADDGTAADTPTASVAAALSTTVRSQRDVLQALGVRGELPRQEGAGVDPAGYLRQLAQSSEATALTATGGLGGFGWLAHARGVPMPSALTR